MWAFILLACAFGLLTAERVEAAPVTWDFIATGCSNPQPPPFGLDVGCDPKLQQYPFELASLTLSGPDSSGSASYGVIPGVTQGDPFAFDSEGSISEITFSSADPLGHLVGSPPLPYVEGYSIGWTETDGILAALKIDVIAEFDEIRLGLNGGTVGSDIYIDGCGSFETCQISGYWANVSLVSSLVTALEPGSLALLASAFGVWGPYRASLHAID